MSVTQAEYRQRLAEGLARLPAGRRREIDEDMAGYFSEGRADGFDDEALCEMLGAPEALAREYSMHSALGAAQEKPTVSNVLRVIWAAIGMGMLNLMFALPVVAAVFAVWVAIAAIAVACLAAGFVVVVCVILYGVPGFMRLVYIENLAAALFTGLATLSLGGLAGIFSLWLGRKLARGFLQYVKTNADVIAGRRKAN